MSYRRIEPILTFAVNPGRIDTLKVTIDLLGQAAVIDSGAWLRPFYISATQDDADALYQMLHEEMTKVDDKEISMLSVVPARVS